MYDFYKLMHMKASESTTDYKSIRQLTLDIANSAGYHREKVTLKNGNEVIRTKYSNRWDDVLVAKWYCHFEKMFCSKLSQLSYMKEYYTQILERTFSIFFNALQVDKVVSNTSVTTTVYACFNNRIGEVMQVLATDNRVKRYNATQGVKVRNSKDRVVVKDYINYSAISLDTKVDELHTMKDVIPSEKVELSDMILDIKNRLGKDMLGLRLLESMVNSDKQISFGNISNFVKLKETEYNSETVNRLRNAYKIILSVVKEYYPDEDYASAYAKKINLKKNKESGERTLRYTV